MEINISSEKFRSPAEILALEARNYKINAVEKFRNKLVPAISLFAGAAVMDNLLDTGVVLKVAAVLMINRLKPLEAIKPAIAEWRKGAEIQATLKELNVADKMAEEVGRQVGVGLPDTMLKSANEALKTSLNLEEVVSGIGSAFGEPRESMTDDEMIRIAQLQAKLKPLAMVAEKLSLTDSLKAIIELEDKADNVDDGDTLVVPVKLLGIKKVMVSVKDLGEEAAEAIKGRRENAGWLAMKYNVLNVFGFPKLNQLVDSHK